MPAVALAFVLASLVMAAGADAGGAAIPFRQGGDGSAELLVRVLGGLVVAVLLAAGAVYALKRYLPSLYNPRFAGPGRIRLVEARRLTPRTTLFLVEVDGSSLLLGQSGERIMILHERAAAGSHDGAEK